MPSDIQYGLDVANRRVLFDADEIKGIKKFGEPGLELLGFKSLSCLLPHHYVKPGISSIPTRNTSKEVHVYSMHC